MRPATRPARAPPTIRGGPSPRARFGARARAGGTKALTGPCGAKVPREGGNLHRDESVIGAIPIPFPTSARRDRDPYPTRTDERHPVSGLGPGHVSRVLARSAELSSSLTTRPRHAAGSFLRNHPAETAGEFRFRVAGGVADAA